MICAKTLYVFPILAKLQRALKKCLWMKASKVPWGRIRAWLLQPHTSTWSRLPALQFHVFFSPPAFFFLVWRLFFFFFSLSFFLFYTAHCTSSHRSWKHGLARMGVIWWLFCPLAVCRNITGFHLRRSQTLTQKNGGAFFFSAQGWNTMTHRVYTHVLWPLLPEMKICFVIDITVTVYGSG